MARAEQEQYDELFDAEEDAVARRNTQVMEGFEAVMGMSGLA